MKEKMKLLKWKWIKFRGGVSYICAILILGSAVLFVLAYYLFERSSIQYDMAFALFSGVIASTIVTWIITIKQEKDVASRKRAILFDAGFVLTTYTEKYQKFVKNPPMTFDEKIKQLYLMCAEAAEYIIELYKSNPELFDEVEIIFITNINSAYSFFNRLLKSDVTDEVVKEYFSAGLTEDSEGMKTYWELANELSDGLLHLMIKWKKDKII